ncbi:MAG: radical SAM protein [Endomicrobiaceae bacterium]|nr:radical SAM protein [Endomicrobiaceae bacterium]
MDKLIKFNSILNNFEINKSAVVLSSIPKNIGIGAHFFCNAKCIFCLGGKYPQFSIDRYKIFFEEKLKDILIKAENVDFHGYGELLLMPDINSFIKRINKTLPNQKKTFFTNGINLKNKDFDDGKFNIIVSLHASNSTLHKNIVGVDGFEDIISNIKELRKQKNIKITLYSVITKINLDDMLNFVRLASKLNVDAITFRYLTIFDYKDFDLTVFMNKNQANENISKSLELAKKLGIYVNVPQMFLNDKTKQMKKICKCPWDYTYIENQGTVNACVFAGKHIGNLSNSTFEDVWNSLKYKNLREELLNNSPNSICRKCIEYDSNNIDKISSHITFRSLTYQKMLKYITENRKKYGLSMKDVI